MKGYCFRMLPVCSSNSSLYHDILFSLCDNTCGQVLESYERAYNNMVRVQQLSELEEVFSFTWLHSEYICSFANKMYGGV